MTQIVPRIIPQAALNNLVAGGCSPSMAKIFAARGISDSCELDTTFTHLLPFDTLKNARDMARLLADAIAEQKKIRVIADYDCDGATACAVAVRGLSAFGARIDFIVPNRFEYGYGLTPEIVHLAAKGSPRSGGAPSDVPPRANQGTNSATMFSGVDPRDLAGTAKGSPRSGGAPSDVPPRANQGINSATMFSGEDPRDLAGTAKGSPRSGGAPSDVPPRDLAGSPNTRPDILLTVDNGIASVEGVDEANRLGMQVFVTDHHLPGDTLPAAACIVNPNQPGCEFPSKHLAGVGVMFYVLLALRAELRNRGQMTEEKGRKLLDLLDLVALGTVADVVKLDQNNRILVQQGLQRIRAGRASKGINALLQVAKKSPEKTVSLDLGFTVGPRLNAAGRLDDMSLGINGLLTDDEETAMSIATRLDALNRERRGIESDMQEGALTALESVNPHDSFSLALFDPGWHQGVIGILASRLKDKFHRPVIAFARAGNASSHQTPENAIPPCSELKGSGRSIPGLHLRDALDLISKRQPKLIKKFGGHAAAAGLSIAEDDFARFADAFEQVSRELLDENDLTLRIETDGTLDPAGMTLETARLLEQQVWGQGFPPPQFDDDFLVQSQRVVGEKHLKLRLTANGQSIDAILFGYNETLPDRIHAVYNLGINEYNGNQSLQLIVRHWE